MFNTISMYSYQHTIYQRLYWGGYVKVVSAGNGDSILPFADMFYLITVVLKMMHEERFHNETTCLLPQEIFWREGGTVLCLVRCLYTDAYPCSHCWSYSLPLWLRHCWWKHTKVNGTYTCKHNLKLHCTHLQKYKTETEALVILSPVSSTSSGLLDGPQYFALWHFVFFLCVSMVFCCHSVVTFIRKVPLDTGQSILGTLSLIRTVLLNFWLETQQLSTGFARDMGKSSRWVSLRYG